MAVETRQKTLQSHIPVIAPRQSQSSLPSSLSTPHLGLVPPTRHLSVSGSPTHPPTNQNPSTSPSLTPFRSFRNFLSFGPGKNQAASSSSAAVLSPSAILPRPSLSTLKRSTNGDRSVSAPHLPVSHADSTPVISIEPSHRVELSYKVDEPLFDNEELQSRLCVQPRTPETSSPVSSISTLSSRATIPTPEQPGKSVSHRRPLATNIMSSRRLQFSQDLGLVYDPRSRNIWHFETFAGS